MTTQQIKPKLTKARLNKLRCPFCGDDDIILESDHFNEGRYYALCTTCVARGPTKISVIRAIKAWNKAKRSEG
jgi:Lar family restriction alleviation protein